MGTGASAGLAAAAIESTDDDLKAALDMFSLEDRQKLARICGARSSTRVARPPSAVGRYLRFVFVNDVYKLDNYPRVASAVKEFKAAGVDDDAVVVAILPGDFLSPCTLTNIDGGVAMLRALNEVPIEYVMFGNHEFDLKPPQLQKRIREFNGKWINSNVTSPEFVDRQGKPLPAYDIIEVGNRKVALGAFLLDDMSQFAPVEPTPQILPPTESVTQTWEKIKVAEGAVDCFVPMVHLNISEDRKFAEAVAKHDELSKITPVLLAAHDHEVYIEQAGKSLIFKVGQDAENIGVIDIYWDDEGKLCRGVHMVQAKEFPLDPTVQTFVKREHDMMDALMNVPIMEIPDEGKKLSTARVRFEMEPMVSFLLAVVRKSMPNVEIVMLQGGNVRGGTAEYKPGPFTYGDLMKELAFDTFMATVKLPGHVIEESIRATRTPEGAKPFFLHCDAEAIFSSLGGEVVLEQVNGAPFDRNKVYTVGTYQFLLAGMGKIEPLFGYCQEHNLCPPLEACLGIKNFFMETCMREAWFTVLGLTGRNVTDHDFEERLNRAFDEIDLAKDGHLHPHEIEAFLAKHEHISCRLVSFLIKSFDTDGDGSLSRAEVQAAAHT